MRTYGSGVPETVHKVSNATPRSWVRVVGSLLRSPRYSHTVSDGDVPIVPTGAVSCYGKLDTWGGL